MIPLCRYLALLSTLSWSVCVTAATDVTLSGYLKVDSIYDLAQKSGDRINYTAIQTGANSLTDGQARIHARESRVRFQWRNNEEALNAVVEIDFYGGGTNSPANSELISNSVSPRLRLAYLEYKHWRLGQDWSNYVDVKSFPENLDFANDTGQAFLRQGQLRYSYQWQNWHISHALENPESDIYQQSIAGSQIARLDPLWDFTHKAKYVADFGHISVQAVMRSLQASVNNIETNTASAYAVAASGRIQLSEEQQLRFHISQGRGIGRYIQEASNFAAYIPISSPEKMQLLTVYGGYLGFQHKWSDTWRSNFNTGLLRIDWPQQAIQQLDNDTTRSYHSIHSNLIWTASKSLEFGIEYSLAKRTNLTRQQGFVRRLQASAKYKF